MSGQGGVLSDQGVGIGVVVWSEEGVDCLIGGRRQTSPRWLLPQSVRIILECILFSQCFLFMGTPNNTQYKLSQSLIGTS